MCMVDRYKYLIKDNKNRNFQNFQIIKKISLLEFKHKIC